MDDLEDELDLKHHRELDPDVYYRCPTLESLDGALRNELVKNAISLIPVGIVTEFVFAPASTITIPVSQQVNLDALIDPADHLQSIIVDYALCRDIDGKTRLKVQRAIARSIVEVIQAADGFKYLERSAQCKEGGDGARFKYICQDSLQNRYRKNNMKKEKEQESEDTDDRSKHNGSTPLPTYDCGGAIYLKFSLKREAINVVYIHNPIHPKPETQGGDLPPLSTAPAATTPSRSAAKTTKLAKVQKGQPKKREFAEVTDVHGSPTTETSTATEVPKAPPKSKRKKTPSATTESTRKSSTKKARKPNSVAVVSAKKSALTPPKLVKGNACLRCREKKIRCNEAKPTCNQCQRGLWECQYEISSQKKRSKYGCVNCKQRRRKCTEERPFCAYCIRVDDDCEYTEVY